MVLCCRCGFSIPGVAICMLIAFSFLIIRAVKVFYNLFKYWQIRQFYITALKIDSVSFSCIIISNAISGQVDEFLTLLKNNFHFFDHSHDLP